MAAAFALCLASVCLAESSPRALNVAEATALNEPIELGLRIHRALSRYFDHEPLRHPGGGVDLLTGWPTLNVLNAVGYISSSDMRLAQKYRVAIAVANFKRTDPALTMETKLGKISFDLRGEITLEDPP